MVVTGSLSWSIGAEICRGVGSAVVERLAGQRRESCPRCPDGHLESQAPPWWLLVALLVSGTAIFVKGLLVGACLCGGGFKVKSASGPRRLVDDRSLIFNAGARFGN